MQLPASKNNSEQKKHFCVFAQLAADVSHYPRAAHGNVKNGKN
jgi:hypothetical protein